jgi:hypothetical protein
MLPLIRSPEAGIYRSAQAITSLCAVAEVKKELDMVIISKTTGKKEKRA